MTPTARIGDPQREAPWEATLGRVVQSVVSIRVTAVRDFDTEEASFSQGTGFIVDAERGLILTNRHMVHAGPVVAEAVFLDNEEVDLVPVYRDPVHNIIALSYEDLDRLDDARAKLERALAIKEKELGPAHPSIAATLLNLADCREKNRQLASAWGAFVEANRMARANGDDKLARVAAKRAALVAA